MPYFRLSRLSSEFLDVVAHDSLRKLVDRDTAVYKVTVLSSAQRARSLLFLARVLGTEPDHQIASPDWWTSEFRGDLAIELKLLATNTVCVYDSEDDQFHPTDVTPKVSQRFLSKTGILGWLDLREQFELEGVSPVGNLIFFASDGARCRSRTTHQHELP